MTKLKWITRKDGYDLDYYEVTYPNHQITHDRYDNTMFMVAYSYILKAWEAIFWPYPDDGGFEISYLADTKEEAIKWAEEII
jgi:hypothetical protein